MPAAAPAPKGRSHTQTWWLPVWLAVTGSYCSSSDVDEPEPLGDRRAALVRRITADGDVGDPVEGERRRRERPGDRGHQAAADGVRPQPVADLDRCSVPAPMQPAPADDLFTVARRFRHGDQEVVVGTRCPALSDLVDELGGGVAILIRPGHERAQVVAAGHDHRVQRIGVAGGVTAQHHAGLGDVDSFGRVEHRSIVADRRGRRPTGFRSQTIAQTERPGDDLVGIVAEHREMSHLAPWAGDRLAVQVESPSRVGQGIRPAGLDHLVATAGEPQVAEQVDHGCRRRGHRRAAEGGPGDGADLLGELARVRRVEGPVSAVVWPRGELVDEQAAARHEQLDRQDTHEVERFGDLRRQSLCRVGHVPVNPGRHDGQIEDPVLMDVLGDRVDGRDAVLSAAEDDAQLEVERHASLDDARHPAELFPRQFDVGGVVDRALSLAVVAEPRSS